MRARSARDVLDMACPRCGSAHTTRISKLDRMRTCPNCRTSFSINERGRYVIEQNWASTRTGRAVTSLLKRLGLSNLDEWLRNQGQRVAAPLRQAWERLPAPWRMPVAVGSSSLVIALVLCWGFTFLASRDDVSNEQAESLQVRAEIACEALLAGDDGVLVGLSTRESQDDLRRWMAGVRPADWPKSSLTSKAAEVDLRTLFKSIKTQRAAVYFVIRTRKNVPDSPTVSGTLCWALAHDGRWQLDGRRTLEELSRARSTD